MKHTDANEFTRKLNKDVTFSRTIDQYRTRLRMNDWLLFSRQGLKTADPQTQGLVVGGSGQFEPTRRRSSAPVGRHHL